MSDQSNVGHQFHELDRIEKVVTEAQNRMQTNVDSFESFIQKKRTTTPKSGEAQVLFAREEANFEESHN